ncbi:hypothetical protein MMC18_004816 [Xylographa bjoerkii]|nr:hypothetical protein [Xylographa bjoerkii]
MPDPDYFEEIILCESPKLADTLYPATLSELKTYKALHQAIDIATPDRIKLVLKQLLESHAKIAASWLTELLLTNDEEIEKERMAHDYKLYHKTSSDEEGSDGGSEHGSEEESNTSMENRNKGLDNKHKSEISKDKPLQWVPPPPSNVRPRHIVCEQCEKEFDVRKNWKKACNYHTGMGTPKNKSRMPARLTWRLCFIGILDVDWDSDIWADHDENCHGPVDTEENKEEYPEGFIWDCCEKRGAAEGCKIGWHKDKARTKTEANINNKRKRRTWE